VTKDFNKRNLTTGDIAKLCGVNFRTVIRWIQRGHLKAFQLPGRGDNRVQVGDFIAFLNENNMPIPEELRPSARRVLLVEGDETAARSMERSLTRAGFETRVAVDGFTAGALFRSHGPAVMTVDVGMKGVDAVELIRAVRGDTSLAPMKVVAVTSATTKKKREELLKAGADDILDRPFKGPELVAKIVALTG
jgi:CheY-like chemotaxis protein